jgi:hypothetical protein
MFLSEAVESASAHSPLMNRKPSSVGIARVRTSPAGVECALGTWPTRRVCHAWLWAAHGPRHRREDQRQPTLACGREEQHDGQRSHVGTS